MVITLLNIVCSVVAIALAVYFVRNTAGWLTKTGASLHAVVTFALLYLALLGLFATSVRLV